MAIDKIKMMNELYARYPALKQPGMIDSKTQTGILSVDGILTVFYGRSQEPNALLDVAQYAISAALDSATHHEKVKDYMLPAIINLHFDFAEILLLEGSRRGATEYLQHIDKFEEKRGEYLAQIANDADSTPDMWAEYGYWLVGRIDKFEDADISIAEAAFNEARKWFAKAEAAGNVDAADALATLTYQYESGSNAYIDAVDLWAKAAMQGHKMAIENLTAVVLGDDRLSDEQKAVSLSAVWRGIDANPQAKQTRKQLQNLGMCKPKDLMQPSVS